MQCSFMSLGLCFWILWLLCLVFGFWSIYPAAGGIRVVGFPLIVFILLTLLGWKVFGPPIQS